jgi:hypothetical protein
VNIRAIAGAAALVGISLRAIAADAPEATEVFRSEGDDNWADYLTDYAAAPISASGILGISGESVTVIENVRSFGFAVGGLTSGTKSEGVGVSITPARTSIVPMNLSTYAQSWGMRLLGSLTASYAQGDATIADLDYQRTAYAVDTNAYFFAADDPILAFANSNCVTKILDETTGRPLTDPAAPSAAPSAGPPGGAMVPHENSNTEEVAAIRGRAQACRAKTLAALRWNRSQISLAYGEGRIKPKDGSKGEDSLGSTLAVGVIYGFDHFDALRENYALSLNYRQTDNEPVLDTLAQPQTVFKDSSLFVGRISGGSEQHRLFFEMSNARSHDVTASQRAFKQALGLDLKIFEGTWLNVRIGKQRKVDGSDDETGTLVSLSYSPKTLLTKSVDGR